MITRLTPSDHSRILTLWETGLNTNQIAARLNVTKTTICRTLTKLKPGYVTPRTRRLRTEI